VDNHRNWAGNYQYRAAELYAPDTTEQLQAWVASKPSIRVLGTRHSFNGIADTTASHLSLSKLNRVIALDRENNRVTVEGGIRYGELCQYLHANGYALHNLASLPHISVAGACATATHGSGDENGNLATAVYEIEVVRADGDKMTFTRGQSDGLFDGAVVGLGGLGVVTKLTLDVVPSFRVSQEVYERLPFERLEDRFESIVSSAYSVSLFTDWQSDDINQVWRKRIVTEEEQEAAGIRPEATLYGAVRADGKRHPVFGHDPVHCTEQLGIAGAWHERLPHFRLAFTPSSGEELQSEYIVPRAQAYEALSALNRIRERIAPLLYTSEIRTIAEDRLWMSSSYKRPSVAIHFTWKPDWAAVRQLLPVIEAQLAPFEARPHWGKLFTMEAEQLQPLYEKLPDFRKLLLQIDPDGKFRNDYMQTYILA
jgi:alditol oxidase